VHDDAFYVPRGLHDAWAPSDPIERYRAWLKANLDGFGDDEDARVREDVKALLVEALRRAEASPLPDPAALADGVFADLSELDTPHHR
jgi:TPP-dependent pyruvate/acetoin dehydrogenase alpha subunit